MATKLEGDAHVTREVGGWLVTMTAAGITMREKGKRTSLGPLSYNALWLRLGMLTAGRILEEKKNAPVVRRGVLRHGR